MSFLKTSLALAAPNLIPDVNDLPGWTVNVLVALLLAGMVEESTYRAFCLIPVSQWINAKIGASVAVVGAYDCAACALK